MSWFDGGEFWSQRRGDEALLICFVASSSSIASSRHHPGFSQDFYVAAWFYIITPPCGLDTTSHSCPPSPLPSYFTKPPYVTIGVGDCYMWHSEPCTTQVIASRSNLETGSTTSMTFT